MATSVYKYPIEAMEAFNVDMPRGAEPLCVQVQNGQPCVWARVVTDEGHPVAVRRFRLAGTGHPLEALMPSDVDGRYVGTFQLRGGALVFHLFDCGEM